MEVLYRLKRNELLLLNDPEKVWVIKSVLRSLFATEVKDKEPVGDVLRQAAPRLRAERGVKRHRRYLFSVDALEALFGAVLDNPKSFLAVAIEATELSQITIADLADRSKFL